MFGLRASAASIALLSVAAYGCGSSASEPEHTEQHPAQRAFHHQVEERKKLERKLQKAKEAKAMELQRDEASREEPSEPSQKSASGRLSPEATGSFEQLAASISGEVGVAIAPLSGGEVETFGSLQVGHAWSTIKVPIVVTLMREGRALSPTEESWAASAIEASDNDAAAALFKEIERSQGGFRGASAAVGETLAAAGDPETTVATAPPPSGAVSTYGQTEWSLAGSATFYRSLANRCLLDSSETEYVLGLMENVIPEQRWGLGEAGLDPSWSVAIKGGWGPESETGGYLVRQSGVISDGSAGIAVAMMAKDASGTYEAGAADLTRIAGWLREHLQGLGTSGAAC